MPEYMCWREDGTLLRFSPSTYGASRDEVRAGTGSSCLASMCLEQDCRRQIQYTRADLGSGAHLP